MGVHTFLASGSRRRSSDLPALHSAQARLLVLVHLDLGRSALVGTTLSLGLDGPSRGVGGAVLANPSMSGRDGPGRHFAQ